MESFLLLQKALGACQQTWGFLQKQLHILNYLTKILETLKSYSVELIKH